jgi:hypothetical protein
MSLNPNALRALGLALTTIVLLCLAGWGLQRCQQKRQVRALEKPAAAHAATLARQQAQRLAADSARLVRAGQTLEATRTATISRRQYDSLRALLPAALPELPAVPPRYRTGH